MIEFRGLRVTASQFAKKAVLDSGSGAFYWTERFEDEYRLMTQREVDEVDRQIVKQFNRVERLFGVSIYND